MIAAEQHACRLVVPSSQQFGAKRWPSHKDHAAKALQKLAGQHLPATLKQLEKAVTKARAELHDAQEQAHAESHKRTAAARKAGSAGAGADALDDTGTSDELEEVDDEAVDELAEEQLDDEDLVDVAGALGPDGHVCSDAGPGL